MTRDGTIIGGGTAVSSSAGAAEASSATDADANAAAVGAAANEGEDDGDRREEWQVQRDALKSSGDDAFRSGDYPHAISSYTSAIDLDPDHVVLYSNRSAAYLSNGEKSRALHDAKRCVELDASFVKGHSRVGAALVALGRYDDAAESYGKALKLDGGTNAAAQKGLDDARRLGREKRERAIEGERAMARMAAEAQKKKIPKHEEAEKADSGTINQKVGTGDDGDAGAKVEEEKEDGGGGGDPEDDLLGDFFNEVEEDVASKKAKKKEQPEEEKKQPSSAAAAANDTAVSRIPAPELQRGPASAGEQIDRILAPNHEWRNLNPYHVLSVRNDHVLLLASLEDTPSLPGDDDVSNGNGGAGAGGLETYVSKRYRSLSRLIHPDKAMVNGVEPDRATDAFEQLRKAMKLLEEGDEKRKYVRDMIEAGMKQGRREFDRERKKSRGGGGKSTSTSEEDAEALLRAQDVAVMRTFAELEHKRREVERRERKYEQRTQEQEDEEKRKEASDRKFDKSWREGTRVEKRVGNWRDFQGGGQKKAKNK